MIDDETIVVIVPPSLPPGPVDITVTTPGGSATYEDYEIAEPDVKPIPTLSEWGMILLTMALLGTGIYYLRNKDRFSPY